MLALSQRKRYILALATLGMGAGLLGATPVLAKEIADAGAPSTPVNLGITGMLSNQISLGWDAGDYNLEAGLGYPDTFVVYRTEGSNTNFANVTPLIVVAGGTNRYTDMSVQPGTAYHYKVAARLGDKESANSTILDVAPASAPFTVNTEALGASRIKLAWNAGPAGTLSYNVYRSTLSGNEVLIASTTEAMYIDTNLPASTYYVYHVKPLTAYGEDYGAITNAISTLASDPVNAPGQTFGLQGNPVTPSANYLSWSAVSGATAYAIYRSSLGIDTLIGTTNNPGYTDASVMSGFVYEYFVKAQNSVGEGLPSTRITIKTATPSAPLVSARVSDRNQVTLSWSAVPGARVYNVYRSSDGGLYIQVAAAVSSTSFVDTNLNYNQTYYYYVKAKAGSSPAYSQADEGPESPTVSVRTLDPNAKIQAPVLSGRALSTSSAELSWNSIVFADHYLLTRDYASDQRPGIGFFPVEGVRVTGTSYVDTQAFPLVRFTYTVRAFAPDGSQSFSSAPVTVELVAPATTPPVSAPKPVTRPAPAVPASQIVFRTPALGGDTTVYVKRGKTVKFTYAYTNTTPSTQLARIVRQFTTLAGKPVKSNGDAAANQTFGARRSLVFSPAALTTNNLAPGLYRVSVKIYSTKKGDNNKLLDQNSFLIQVEL